MDENGQYIDGDVWSYEEAETIRRSTGTQGVMSARGLLANPVSFPVAVSFFRMYYLHVLVDSNSMLCPFLPPLLDNIGVVRWVFRHPDSCDNSALFVCWVPFLHPLTTSTELPLPLDGLYSSLCAHTQTYRVHARIRTRPSAPTRTADLQYNFIIIIIVAIKSLPTLIGRRKGSRQHQ